MRVGAILRPVGDWQAIPESAKIADAGGLDAVGCWDHYHSEKPEWAYVCGWSAYGMLAAATKRIKLTPMVICRLNSTLGVPAKESAILTIVSDGRFELGIGAGDYRIEYSAWHQPFPDATTRVAALAETITTLSQEPGVRSQNLLSYRKYALISRCARPYRENRKAMGMVSCLHRDEYESTGGSPCP